MSYQVLARKWRPKTFAELAGQEHVVRALTHALGAGRLHPALLFTGTRGVGKTTIARIVAKSLNCDTGITAEPCGRCSACVDVDAGRFPDLLEIDAASRTKVEDTRELLDRIVYAPSRGRRKVYLIDEVHMLSGHSFNALLKTLEEPPEHVQFLLATTDPQKLPITVLSRCLKFHLKRLTVAEIAGQMERILSAEQLGYDREAVRELARAADGSMRDGLSLLDQALAYGGGELRTETTRAMLGAVAIDRVQELLLAVLGDDRQAVARNLAAMAEFAPNYRTVLKQLLELLHGLAMVQILGAAGQESVGLPDALLAVVDRVEPERVQLDYQIALDGLSDLDLLDEPRLAFEMLILRMLAFAPLDAEAQPASASAAKQSAVPRPDSASGRPPPEPTSSAATVPTPSPPTPERATASSDGAEPEPMARWRALVDRSGLRGPALQLALELVPIRLDGDAVEFALPADREPLLTAASRAQIESALAELVPGWPKPRIALGGGGDSLGERTRREREQRRRAAEAALLADGEVRALESELGARLVPGSVKWRGE